MCLNSINEHSTDTYKRKIKPIVAYKIVQRSPFGDSYEPYFYSYPKFKKGVNKVTDDITLFLLNDTSYKSGFHAFLNLKEAQGWLGQTIENPNSCNLIIKIFINPKDVIAVGKQYRCEAIVASKITIKSFKFCENES